MDKIIEKIKNNRLNDNPVNSAWSFACSNLGIVENDPIVIFGQLLCEHEGLKKSDNAYHNHYHSADAMITASFLANEEFSKKDLRKNGVLLVISMMGHDLNHSGSTNKYDYELEKISYQSLNDFVTSNKKIKDFWDKNLSNEFGSWESFSKKIEEVILGTDFKLGPAQNIQNYNLSDTGDYKINKIKMLANEADILPSCTAELGPELGLYLAKEQNNEAVGSWKGREFFLKNLAKFHSKASENVGIVEHIKKQVDLIDKYGVAKLDELSKNGNFSKVASQIKVEVSDNFSIKNVTEKILQLSLNMRDMLVNKEEKKYG